MSIDRKDVHARFIGRTVQGDLHWCITVGPERPRLIDYGDDLAYVQGPYGEEDAKEIGARRIEVMRATSPKRECPVCHHIHLVGGLNTVVCGGESGYCYCAGEAGP